MYKYDDSAIIQTVLSIHIWNIYIYIYKLYIYTYEQEIQMPYIRTYVVYTNNTIYIIIVYTYLISSYYFHMDELSYISLETITFDLMVLRHRIILLRFLKLLGMLVIIYISIIHLVEIYIPVCHTVRTRERFGYYP